MTQGKKGTGPDGIFGQKHGMKQIAVRVDRHTVDELYRMLKEEKMTLQTFLALCIDRYVKSDPRMRGIVEAFRRDNQVSKREAPKFRLSDKEKKDLLTELEEISPIPDTEGEGP